MNVCMYACMYVCDMVIIICGHRRLQRLHNDFYYDLFLTLLRSGDTVIRDS